MKSLRLITIVISLLVVAGCGYTIMEGKKFDAAKRGELVKGQMTASQVVQILGQPVKIEKKSPGEEKYIYHYYKEEYTHWWTLPKREMQKLEVVLKNGIVEDYSYTEEGRDKITKEDK